ncbi:MAG: glycosyltransferase family 4 protein [Candidatus Micrarchaeia archaeon]
MIKVLIIESGSFKNIGGAAKDSLELYKYLSKKPDMQVEIYGSFEELGYKSRTRLDSIYAKKFDILMLNSIRDVPIAEKYISLHEKVACVYVDRGDVLTHHAHAPAKRLLSKAIGLIESRIEPSRLDKATTEIASRSESKLVKAARNYASKVYAIRLFERLKKFMSCYVAINAEQALLARKVLKLKAIEYIPIAPHKEFRKIKVKKDYAGALYVGRLEETQKNVSFMIKGVYRTKKEHKELAGKELLRIIGEGPDEQYYKAMVSRLGLQSNISFLGFKAYGELVKQYNNCGFLVSCSRWESFGRVFIEAMMCGVPVLLNDRNNKLVSVEPERYVVQDRVTGLVYHYNSLRDFADKFYALYSDSKLRARLSKNAYAFAKSKFSIERTYEKYYKLFKDLASRQAQSP